MDKATILLVDDTPANLKTLAAMLRRDYRIIISKSGEEALSLIEKGERPDLILLDIMMPGMDGYDLCKNIKDNPETEGIPVIFISAKSGEKEREKGLALGAVDYVTKPFDAVKVRKAVEEYL